MNHVVGVRITVQMDARRIVRSTAVGHVERLAKADAKKIVQADAQVVHHRVRQDAEVDAQKVVRAVHHAQGATAVARHLVVDVRVAHLVRGHVTGAVADVRVVQDARRGVNPVRGIVKHRVPERATALVLDVRPLAQALATMLAQRQTKRRLSRILAVISASGISSH